MWRVLCASFLIPSLLQAGVVEDASRHAASDPTGSAPATFIPADFADAQALRGLPIGVFDSGIGGLTVLEAILKLDAFQNQTLRPGPDGIPDFAGESFLYLGDQANMPYGNYSAVGKADFLRELILRDAIFLLGRRYHETATGPVKMDKPPVKAIVIACNTATAYGLEDIRAAIALWKIPVIVVGVVEAGSRGVAEDLPAEISKSTVGVLATVGTCATGAYPKTINRLSGQAGKSPPTVLQQGSIGLAGAIEGDPGFITSPGAAASPYLGPRLTSAQGYDATGLLPQPDGSFRINSVLNYLRHDLRSLMQAHRQQPDAAPLQRLVLGCTHFPLVTSEMQTVLDELRAEPDFAARIAPQVSFVNPAELTAKELFRSLANALLRNTTSASPAHRFFISVPNPAEPGTKVTADGRLDRDYQYARSPGQPARQDTVVVPMTPSALPASSRQLLENHLPLVWAALNR